MNPQVHERLGFLYDQKVVGDKRMDVYPLTFGRARVTISNKDDYAGLEDFW